jgi:hypothetical protein
MAKKRIEGEGEPDVFSLSQSTLLGLVIAFHYEFALCPSMTIVRYLWE